MVPPMKSLLVLSATIAFATLTGCGSGSPSSEPAKTHESHGGHGGRVLTEPAAASAEPSERLHELMMRPMADMTVTGNVDKDFATMMGDHHQQAVDMVDAYLPHAKNPDLRQMAEAMRTEQAAEIARLRDLAAKETPGQMSESSSKLHALMMRPMERMQTTGDVDRDFALLMAEHHQGAIEMAKIELEQGMNADIKAMAQQMIDSQTIERDRLLSLVGQRP